LPLGKDEETLLESMLKLTTLRLFIAIGLPLQGYAIGLFPPVIVVPPLDQTVLKGGSATFTVVATSTTALSYQWRLNGTNISGATGTLPVAIAAIIPYTRTNIQTADLGNYSVELRNGVTVVSSSAALKTVNVPLQFNLAAPTVGGFHLNLTGITSSNYVIYASSNMINWTPISTNSGLSGVVDFTDTTATNIPSRFYRAQLQ
jgi:hypothetical protein